MTESDFRQFCDRNGRGFESFARAMARRHELNAHDFLSDALLKSWIRFRREEYSVEIEGHIRSYVLKCITNNSRKWYRRSKWEAQIDEKILELPEMTPMLDEARIARILDEVLAKLPPNEEAAVRLCYLTNPQPTPKEAARALGCSVATLYRRLGRARNSLGAAFGDLGLQYSF